MFGYPLRVRALAAAIVVLGSLGAAYGQTSIRQVDFKNRLYPLSGPTLGHDHLQWLDLSGKRHFRLVQGKDSPHSPTFELSSIQYADVTGDGKEEAIVVIHQNTGGTQQSNYIYVYTSQNGEAELLAYCYTGDRAYSGLYGVYAKDGLLVVELNDPSKSEGDCCSIGFIRTRCAWRNGKFVPVGRREYGPIHLEEH